jgi:hypothetical protein
MFRSLFLLTVCASLASAATIPGVVSSSSNLLFSTTLPPSLSTNQVQSNTNVFGYAEKIGYVLSQAVLVDTLTNGAATYDQLTDLTPGFLPVGMRVNSYFMHFDPATGTLLQNRTAGTVQIVFESDLRIVGIQLGVATLNSAVSGQLMLPGVNYETNNLLRGLEFVNVGSVPKDVIQLIDSHTIQFTLNSSTLALDEMRILVQTPEPSYALLIAPAIGLLLWRRRRVVQL